MKPSDKQIMLLEAIKNGDGNGGLANLDMILEQLAYETTKQSLHFSIRALIRQGLIKKEDCAWRPEDKGKWKRRFISITPEGMKILQRFKRTVPREFDEIIF